MNIATRLARITRAQYGFCRPARFVIEAVDQTPYISLTLTYNNQKEVKITGITDERLAERMHLLCDEAEADLGIFIPNTTAGKEVAA